MTVGKQSNRRAFAWLAICSTCLVACTDEARSVHPPQMVRTIAVERADYSPTVALTGEIRPRVESVQSFRVAGRVVSRAVEIGDHVEAGRLLASLDPAELTTGVTAAQAAVDAAQAQQNQAASAFSRQQALLAKGFTTRRAYDQADETLRTASAAQDEAKAQLESARDQLAHVELRAPVAGVVTARSVEVGQVVQVAQPVFTIAGDGFRDAVFNVDEAIFSRVPDGRSVVVALVADTRIATTGTVREVSPALNAIGTVEVRVGLADPPPAMGLGAAVSGVAKFRTEQAIAVPWQALTTQDGAAAVWIADPASKTVSLRAVGVDHYDADRVVIHDGLTAGEIVVTAGSQLLRPGQKVEFANGEKP